MDYVFPPAMNCKTLVQGHKVNVQYYNTITLYFLMQFVNLNISF